MPDTIKPGTPTAEHMERARAEFRVGPDGGTEGWNHRGLMITPAGAGMSLDEAIHARAVDIEMTERYIARHIDRLRMHLDHTVQTLSDRMDRGLVAVNRRMDSGLHSMREDLTALAREVSFLRGADSKSQPAPAPAPAPAPDTAALISAAVAAASSSAPAPPVLTAAQRVAVWVGGWSPWHFIILATVVVGGSTAALTIGMTVTTRMLDVYMPLPAAPSSAPVPTDTAYAVDITQPVPVP